MSGFLWGVATAACQVEGGTTGADWESFTTEPAIKRRVNQILRFAGDTTEAVIEPPGDAVGHARLEVLRADLDRARLLGATAYRFSVEWSRLEPAPGEFREEVLQNYYVEVVKELRARGMEPVVTLQHLSLPAWALTPPVRSHKLGPLPISSGSDPGFRRSLRGWESEATVEAFARFVTRVVPALRDAGVHYWLTLNEPAGSVVGLGYVAGIWPPGFVLAGRRARAAHLNLLRAHVRAYDAIKACDPEAMVGVAHAMFVCEPPPGGRGWRGRADAAASEQSDYFYNQHFLDSVVSGRVDVAVDRRPARRSYVDARDFFSVADRSPRLDYVGINYYRPYNFRFHPLFAAFAGFCGGMLAGAPATDLTIRTEAGHRVHAGGLATLARWIKDAYDLPVLITENGLAERADRHRAAFIVSHLESLREAAGTGVRVLGYLHWSLLDNWEWVSGYHPSTRSGLLTVDRQATGGELPRALTEGALAYRHLALGGAPEEARARYGFFTDGSTRVAVPVLSPGALWGGDVMLHLTRLDGTRLAGLLFEAGWLAMEDIRWDPEQRSLQFRAGGRDREARLAGEELWLDGVSLQRRWLEGVWVPERDGTPLVALHLTGISRWDTIGSTERWLAKTNDGTQWRANDVCEVSPNGVVLGNQVLELEAAGSRPRLTARGRGWSLVRLPDQVLADPRGR